MRAKSKILVTGGTGFIGSHTCVALAEAGYEPVILDNLTNSRGLVVERIADICGIQPLFVEGDIRDGRVLERLFSEHRISAVVHFAGLKAIDESLEKPLEYYDNNVGGTLSLIAAMRRSGVHTLIFSSSAVVYGSGSPVPVHEGWSRSSNNPYGRTKIIIEDLLEDLHRAKSGWRVARLRYFNPVGAHPSGLIGEDPKKTPRNLMPFVAKVAMGNYDELQIFGNDYPTRDGSCIRDYVHVMDIAEGHIAALGHLARTGGLITANLGTGIGVSVLELVAAFERASGRKVPRRIVGRRTGDIVQLWADVSHAKALLGWCATRNLDQMCADMWRWQQNAE